MNNDLFKIEIGTWKANLYFCVSKSSNDCFQEFIKIHNRINPIDKIKNVEFHEREACSFFVDDWGDTCIWINESLIHRTNKAGKDIVFGLNEYHLDLINIVWHEVIHCMSWMLEQKGAGLYFSKNTKGEMEEVNGEALCYVSEFAALHVLNRIGKLIEK